MYHLSSFHIVSKKFVETELESIIDKEIFHFLTTYHVINFHWLHLHSSSVERTWYTTVVTENWRRDATNTLTQDATDTQRLSEKLPRKATSKPHLHIPERHSYAHFMIYATFNFRLNVKLLLELGVIISLNMVVFVIWYFKILFFCYVIMLTAACSKWTEYFHVKSLYQEPRRFAKHQWTQISHTFKLFMHSIVCLATCV